MSCLQKASRATRAQDSFWSWFPMTYWKSCKCAPFLCLWGAWFQTINPVIMSRTIYFEANVFIRRPAVAGRCRAVCRGWFHKDGRRGPAIWWAARWNPASLRPFSVTAGCGLPKWILHISDELRHGVVSVLHPAFYLAKRAVIRNIDYLCVMIKTLHKSDSVL